VHAAVAFARAGTGRDRPATRALLPQWIARLVGFAALASVGALEWQRLVGGLSSGRALLWVAVAVASAVAVLVAARAPVGWPGRLAMPAVAVVALLAGYWLSGAGLGLLRPRHWDELGSGLGGGLQALGTVRLPYVSVDSWPRVVLELMGAELLIIAGLLTFWPRLVSEPDQRTRVDAPDRGYPFVALVVLLVVVASPVVSLGGTRPLVLGLILSAFTVCFLWLERLPLKPGLGVAALVAIALAGALPLAAVADRGEPWFDYRSFAESLGPDDPVQFSWTQSYGPITWPRDGNEVMRITSSQPHYWKARNLDVFDRTAWTTRPDPGPLKDGEPFGATLPEDWRSHPAWTNTISVSVRRMRTTDVIGAGAIVGVQNASRGTRPATSSGTYDAPSGLRRGDSYTLEVHDPKPSPAQLGQATSGVNERQEGERVLTVPFLPGRRAPLSRRSGAARTPVLQADVHFKAWDDDGGISYAEYPTANRSEFDIEAVMKRSMYARTWALSKRLKRGAERPMDYIRAVDRYLHGAQFTYTERPAQPGPNVAPLDYFLNDSHQGYCQHYAGAMALLLRMGGISARVATGFSPGGYSDRRKTWVVRDTDAHAWVEAWFDRYGWVTFDPTPDATPARSQIAALNNPVTSVLIAPDRAPGGTDGSGGTATAVGGRPNLLLGTNNDTRGTGTAAGTGPRWWAWIGGILLVGVLVLSVLLFIRRPRGGTPMDRAIAEVEDAMRRVGRPVSTGTTLSQLERRLGSHSPEVAAYLRALAAGRYAAAPAPPPRTGRRALRRALAQGLGFGGGLRALWALPPHPKRPRRAQRPTTFEVDTTVRG
jgi:transglutaminase-like putative cysteine protease